MKAIYRCKYHGEFTSLSPREWKMATGRFVTCPHCGNVVRWVREVPEEVVAARNECSDA